jgi:Fe-S oxidoreductase
MAGAFGYEAEHYELSMKIGELKLLPAVRAAGEDMLIAASGVSCEAQIKDGTGRSALHPVELVFKSL